MTIKCVINKNDKHLSCQAQAHSRWTFKINLLFLRVSTLMLHYIVHQIINCTEKKSHRFNAFVDQVVIYCQGGLTIQRFGLKTLSLQYLVHVTASTSLTYLQP